MPRLPLRRFVPAAALLALLPVPVAAQSPADLIEQAREAYERRAEGIENYTIVQTTAGQETTQHFYRTEVDGYVLFLPADERAGAGVEGEPIDPLFFFRPDVAARMTLEGTDEVEGEGCHVLHISDLDGLGLEEVLPEAQGTEVRGMSFCIDDDADLIRAMTMEMTTTAGGSEPSDITTRIELHDYRDVGGMMHPWRVEVHTEGMAAMMQANPQMQEALAQMEQQLEQMPEAQREMMREMMEGRMEQMMEMMGGGEEGGPMIVIEVQDVTVNEAPPAGGM